MCTEKQYALWVPKGEVVVWNSHMALKPSSCLNKLHQHTCIDLPEKKKRKNQKRKRKKKESIKLLHQGLATFITFW